MSNEKGSHLDKDQLLWAVVDEAELSSELRDHLSTCPLCRAEKERIEQDLARLGQMAQRFAPSPRREVLLPVEESRNSSLWSWDWRVVLGAAMTTALVILVVSWSLFFKITPEDRLARLTQEMWEDERLMTEISMLEEDPLPQLFLDVSAESFSEIDEEFIEFIVPIIEGETLSHDQGKRGDKLC
ncbi:MAG: hypothetical protein J7L53_12770 [Deltaproteobacteria bacterium]|nr:hypothetical protein [Deltaproteobacteria bacterium]